LAVDRPWLYDPVWGDDEPYRAVDFFDCQVVAAEKDVLSVTESASERILVTGGFGCIGVQVVKWLLSNTDATVIVGAREVTAERMNRLFGASTSSRLSCVRLDVRDLRQIEDVLQANEVTRVVHLAALQTPDCNANRDLGLQINLAGTQNLIEAVKKCRPLLSRFVFASSVAVYGPRRSYPGPKVSMLAEPAPVNVYGAWKLAGEQITRFLFQETGIPSLCIRPGVLFGPGRDAGLTAAPTTAMKHVALRLPYEIPFKSRQDYLYAPDVGAAFGNALMAPFSAYGVFTLPSHTVDTQKFLETLHQAAAELGCLEDVRISVGDSEVPFICDLEFEPFLNAFPSTPHTPLLTAVKESLIFFRQQVADGWLKV
jgi:nucleoside-diphosphate-sugar epimerase